MEVKNIIKRPALREIENNYLLEEDFNNLMKGGNIEVFDINGLNQAREAIYKTIKENPKDEAEILKSAHNDFAQLHKKTVLLKDGNQTDYWLRELSKGHGKVSDGAYKMLSEIAKYFAMDDEEMEQQDQMGDEDMGSADDESKVLIEELVNAGLIQMDDEGNIDSITPDGSESLQHYEENMDEDGDKDMNNDGDGMDDQNQNPNDMDSSPQNQSDNQKDDAVDGDNQDPDMQRNDDQNDPNMSNDNDNAADEAAAAAEAAANADGANADGDNADPYMDDNNNGDAANQNDPYNEEQNNPQMQEDDINGVEDDPGSQEMGDGADDPENDGTGDDDMGEQGNQYSPEQLQEMVQSASDDDLKAFVQDPAQPDNLKQIAAKELERRAGGGQQEMGNDDQNMDQNQMGNQNQVDPQEEAENEFQEWMDKHFDEWDREDMEDMVKDMMMKSPGKRKEMKMAFKEQYPRDNDNNQFSGRVNKEGVDDLNEFILKYLGNMTEPDLKKYGMELMSKSPEYTGKMKKTYTSFKDSGMIDEKKY